MNDDLNSAEPSFAGAGRHLRVCGIGAVFDQVKSSSLPVWVALESRSGWG